MRLVSIQDFLKEKGWPFQYVEEDGLGSIDFEYRGIGYHIWEFKEERYGAESNVKEGGKQEDYYGDYENQIINIIKEWR